MSDTTTIKVPRLLRDRLAERAKQEQIPLAQVIEHALNENEDRAFWAHVNADHAGISRSERGAYSDIHGRVDNLADEADDNISQRGQW